MTVDFNAEFALGGGYDGPEALLAWFAAEPLGLRETVDRYRARWGVSAWTAGPCRAQPAYAQILGPGGFVLTLSPVSASLYHRMRFAVFAHDPLERGLLRRSCSAIARRLGSPRALLMPELTPSGFFEGLDLDASEARLRATIGPPATTWEELAAAGPFEPRSWCVETFDDAARS